MFPLINLTAVFIATIVGYLVGWAWYSPILWQKPWMAARGDTGEYWKKNGRKEMPRMITYGLLTTFAQVFTIAVFLALVGTETLLQTTQVSLLLCFGLTVTLRFSDLLYTALPPHWGKRAQIIFFVDAGYQIALFLIASTILWYLG